MSSGHSDTSVGLPPIDEGAWKYRPAPRDAGQPWGTWLWLADDSKRHDLLVLGRAASLGIMTSRFSTVREHHVLGSTSLAPFPHAASSFDYVVARGAMGSLEDDQALWVESSRVLRPGGTLYTDGPNPMWFRSLVGTRGNWLARFRRVARLARMLEASGFRDVRIYYAEPDLTAPRAIIPAASLAVAAWQRFALKRGAHRLLRIAAAVTGRHDFLFREVLLVARK